jgi:hypothetical protein
MNDNDEARKKKETEKKIRDVLKAEAVKVHPKGTVDDIKKKIEKKKKK